MIQLKVLSDDNRLMLIPADFPLPDITKLHRQLRRLGRRVRQRPEEEAARNDRSVPGATTDMGGLQFAKNLVLILVGYV